MKSIKTIALLGLTASFLSGCTLFGNQVEVPTAHRGIISTATGLKEEILPPSKLRLSGFCMTCDSLIVAEVSDYAVVEKMELYMPKDRLNITFDIRGTFATSDDPEQLRTIFSRVPPSQITDRTSLITSEQVFDTYARQIIRDRARAVISEYDIATVMANREAVAAEISDAVRESLKGRPVVMLNIGFGDIQPPKLIIEAEESRKEREIAIEKAEAQKEVDIQVANSALEVAEIQRQVDLAEAETQVMVEHKLREGFSEAYVAQRALRILEQLAESDNNVIFLPTEALANPAVMIGSMSDALANIRKDNQDSQE